MPRSSRHLRRVLVVLVALALPALAPASALGVTRSLTVVKQGFQKGTVTSSPAGIVCGSTCTNDFPETCDVNGCAATLVTLSTTLPSGFTVSWQGLTCQGGGETQTGSACTVAADTNSVTARYIDSTAPTISLTSPSSAGPFSGSLSMAASAFDSQSDIARVDFTVGATVVGSDTTAPYDITVDSTTLLDGQTSVGAVAFNGDSQAKTANPRSITIDNTAPELAITSGPDEGQVFGPGSTQTFAFTAADVSSVTTICSLDSETTFTQCTDSATFTDLSEGVHVFRVRAGDAAGNETSAARSFAVDRTGPVTTITSGPAEFSSDAPGRAAFTFAADEPVLVFACRLYPAGVPAPDLGLCSGGTEHSGTGLAPGDWTFEVRAIDAFGNLGPSAVRHFSVVFSDGLDRIAGKFATSFSVRSRSTRVRKLRLSALPIGTTVAVTCRGQGCAFKRRSVKSRGARATLEGWFRGRALRPGVLIEIRMTAAGLTGQVARFKVRRSKSPQRTNLCLAPGGSKPVACR
jgi:hypothetical protein